MTDYYKALRDLQEAHGALTCERNDLRNEVAELEAALFEIFNLTGGDFDDYIGEGEPIHKAAVAQVRKAMEGKA
jgi:hypothetical protein